MARRPDPSPLPCSKKRLSKVGEALAAGDPSDEDLELYAAALDAFDQRTVWLRNAIDELDWDVVLGRPIDLSVTGRTKTLGTLVDKLERQPDIKLPYIRDVAGVRVVGDLLLSEQDAIARHLLGVFGGAATSLVDRRAEPESGYRALHVVVQCHELPVEVQIRTDLQAMWADLYERQADLWGRQMRYGQPPPPDSEGVTERRVEVVRELHAMSLERIAPIEELRSNITELVRGIGGFESDLVQARRERGRSAVSRQTAARAYLARERPRVLKLQVEVDHLIDELKRSLLELGASAEKVK